MPYTILRPAEKNLVDSIKAIEESDKFAFLIKPDYVYSLFDDDVIKDVEIDHLSMRGPRRYHTQKLGESYYYGGPLWRSEIDILAIKGFDDINKAAEYFMGELLGKASAKNDHNYWSRWGADLRYDFPPDLQPDRDDGVEKIPHVIKFVIKRPDKIEDMVKKEEHKLLEGSLGDYAERILFPPPPWHYWYKMPAAQKMIEEKLAAGK